MGISPTIYNKKKPAQSSSFKRKSLMNFKEIEKSSFKPISPISTENNTRLKAAHSDAISADEKSHIA